MQGDLEYSEKQQNFGYCMCIKVEEIKRTINRMSRGRAIGSNEILVQFWKSTCKDDMEWLTDIQNCNNYTDY